MIPEPVTAIATFLPEDSTSLSLDPGGSAKHKTPGVDDAIHAGYANLLLDSGVTPYGTAVFSFRQNGVTVTEAGIPASPPTKQARVFIDFRKEVNAVPARSEAGNVDVNTGIAIVNPGSVAADVTYRLRNASGQTITTGHGTIEAGRYFACFIDQLKEKAGAPDFDLPPDFPATTQFGSLEISSTEPLSVLALRGTLNQRGEFLLTTTPVADLEKPLPTSPFYFPQFADGGGYTTSLVLLNTSTLAESGKMELIDAAGNPFTVTPVGGTADSSFSYSIPPRGVFRFQTDGFPVEAKAGWVRLTPDAGTSAPVGSGVFSFNPADILVSESGIPSAASTTHARIYVDLSDNHNSGLALANLADSKADIAVKAYEMDGNTPAGDAREPVQLDPKGYTAAFADQLISGLPAGFTGVLDISSETPFAALTLRSLNNERGDFLMTTFPVADMTTPAPSPLVFPQVADGGGYSTEFILISAGGAASTVLSFYGENGTPLDFGE